VLELDPELAAGIAPAQRSRAVEASCAPIRVFSLGAWSFEPPPDLTSLGALILKGMLVLRIEFAGGRHLEVLGEGDVLNPWLLGTEAMLEEQTTVQVVQSGCVALLDSSFVMQMTPWPEVSAALMRRLVVRVRRLILQTSILSSSRVDERLELMLWLLADQFGHMTRDGLLVRLPFTHRQLAEMVAAQRPTVTLAVNRLIGQGRLRRPGANQWLLPRVELARLRALSTGR
jgi:CRP-like cAMP-binding protein